MYNANDIRITGGEKAKLSKAVASPLDEQMTKIAA